MSSLKNHIRDKISKNPKFLADVLNKLVNCTFLNTSSIPFWNGEQAKEIVDFTTEKYARFLGEFTANEMKFVTPISLALGCEVVSLKRHVLLDMGFSKKVDGKFIDLDKPFLTDGETEIDLDNLAFSDITAKFYIEVRHNKAIHSFDLFELIPTELHSIFLSALIDEFSIESLINTAQQAFNEWDVFSLFLINNN